MNQVQPSQALLDACADIGLDAGRAEPVALGENEIWRLPGPVIARVARAGQQAVAGKEVQVARWLYEQHVPAVRVHAGIDQPVYTGDQAVTFWDELPPHARSTPDQLGRTLKRLHQIPIPGFLHRVEPFVRLPERIAAARTLSNDQRVWLRNQLNALAERWDDLPAGPPDCVLHGDAHADNIVTTPTGQSILLDLERFANGPPEWDLLLTATHHASCGWGSDDDYADFCAAYGSDVTTSPRYEYLRDIRELRLTLFAGQLAAEHPEMNDQAVHRLECLQGLHGPRPWPGWKPLP